MVPRSSRSSSLPHPLVQVSPINAHGTTLVRVMRDTVPAVARCFGAEDTSGVPEDNRNTVDLDK
ncbi:hypothetical protein Halhy_1585 [Haliscomenobacter hydrossis DSM 1100]|uniref:Uncharacterized protein n=1 Tax=Haliscomenobacter hydrossis (strain ATCC 27775 / DSM 1100 / LMG 10767 / O) TaxID=760192 RepID=F4KZK6_HALH1|nr:hypothetical protein Halhy_1585 [Haliscomenobacter hydrossis DSM 1100]